ncbi:MAG TPA: DUF4142 domain-containing protein [Gemmatimonadaceae bacterium]|nr:DUF4142 domain-containing protein [Gemmatimonadaceae bacterium]
MIRACTFALVVLTAVICGSSPAFAQNWEVGAKGGLLHSRLSGSGEFTWHGGRPTGAFLLRRALTARLNAQAEFGAFRRNGLSLQPASTLTLTADYLDVPVVLQYRLSGGRNVLPYVAFGPNVNYRMRCSLLFQGGGFVSDDDCDAALGSRSHRVDVGAVAGIGVEVRVAGTTVQLESRLVGGARSNVLPIDIQARAAGWSVTAGVIAPLARTAAREPSPPLVVRARGDVDDAQIAAIVMAYANTDISYQRLVPRRSTRDDVHQFARTMLGEHEHILREMSDMAAQLDLSVRDHPVSVGLRDESTAERETMYFVNGASFDSAYVEAETRVQREFLSTLDDLLAQPKRNAEVRALLVSLRPAVEARLAAASRLQRRVLGQPPVAVAPAARNGAGATLRQSTRRP